MPFSRFVCEGWDPEGFKQFGEESAPLYLSAGRRFLAGFCPWVDTSSRHQLAVIAILRLFDVALPADEVVSVLRSIHNTEFAALGGRSISLFTEQTTRAVSARWDLLNVVDYGLFRSYADDRRFVQWLASEPADVLDGWYQRFWPEDEPRCDSRRRNFRLGRLRPMPRDIVSAFHGSQFGHDWAADAEVGEFLVARTQQWLMNYHAVFMAPSSVEVFAHQQARIRSARARLTLREALDVLEQELGDAPLNRLTISTSSLDRIRVVAVAALEAAQEVLADRGELARRLRSMKPVPTRIPCARCAGRPSLSWATPDALPPLSWDCSCPVASSSLLAQPRSLWNWALGRTFFWALMVSSGRPATFPAGVWALLLAE